MTDTNPMIAEATQRIFRDLGDPRAYKTSSSNALWNALEEAGLTRAWTAESLSGAGASIADGFEVLQVAGSYAASVPLPETLLGSWLLAQANIATPDGILTIAPVDPRDVITLDAHGKLSGAARAIPFARNASNVAVVATRASRTFVALVNRSSCTIKDANNLAGDARDAVTLNNVTPLSIVETFVTQDSLLLMGAAIRATQMAGALQGALDLSVAYANERIAFEKPIGKFQAIQHSLAKLAGETAAAIAAASSAADAISSSSMHSPLQFDDAIFLEIASAKIRVGEAAAAGAAIAHQVHGAIGFSDEHVLHQYTQRLWAWRDDFGSESYWALRLGKLIARNGADALWPMLASR